MWGVCCAGISPVGLVSEFLLSVVLFPDQVDCVLSAGSLGLVDQRPLSERDSAAWVGYSGCSFNHSEVGG